MAERRPIVLTTAGGLEELPAGDTVAGASGVADGDKGDVIVSVGATVWTLTPAAITGKAAVTPVGTDYVLISDTSDAGALKKVLISDLSSGGGLTQQQVEGLI